MHKNQLYKARIQEQSEKEVLRLNCHYVDIFFFSMVHLCLMNMGLVLDRIVYGHMDVMQRM